MFHSVNEIAQFVALANRQPFPVHFNYKDSRLDAKSILSLCALPLQTPVTVDSAGSRGGQQSASFRTLRSSAVTRVFTK